MDFAPPQLDAMGSHRLVQRVCLAGALIAGVLGLAFPGCLRGETLALRERVLEQPEMGPVTWWEVRSAAGDFALMPPLGWKPQPPPAPGVLRLASPDYTTQLYIEFRKRESQAVAGPEPAPLRRRVEETYPQAVVSEEFESFTGGTAGKAVDVRWRPSPGVEMAARIVEVRFPEGTVEFRLVARPENIQESYHALGALLVSFKTTAWAR